MIELILLAVFVVSLTFALYKISLLGTKETSFEEAISSQKNDILVGLSIKKPKEKEKVKKVKTHKKEEHINPSHIKTAPAINVKVKEVVPKESLKKAEVKEIKVITSKAASTKASEDGSKLAPLESTKAHNEIKKRNKEASDFLEAQSASIRAAKEVAKASVKILNVIPKKEAIVASAVDKPCDPTTQTSSLIIEDGKNKKVLEKNQKSKKKIADGPMSDSLEEEKKQQNQKSKKKVSDGEVKEEQIVSTSENELKTASTSKNNSHVTSTDSSSKEIKDDAKTKASTNPKKKVEIHKNRANSGSSQNQGEMPRPAEPKNEEKSAKVGTSSAPRVKDETTEKKFADEKVAVAVNNMEENLKKLQTANPKPSTMNLEVPKGKKKTFSKANKDLFSDDIHAKLLFNIEKSTLTGGETQSLIDALLNKELANGQRGDEWVEVAKVDPVVSLKKQLEEMKAKLTEEADSQHALSSKIQELRSNLNEQISKNAALKKRLESVDDLQQKLDESSKQFESKLLAHTTELKANLEQEYQAKLLQSQKIATNKCEAKVAELQHTISELENKQLTTHSNLGELQVMFKETEAKLHSVTRDYESAHSNNNDLQSKISSLELLLSTHKSESEERVKILEKQLSLADADRSSTSVKMTQVMQENDNLHQQLRNYEGVKDVLNQNQNMLKNVMQQKAGLEKDLSESSREVKAQKDVVEKQRRMIEMLKEEKHSLASQVIRPAAEGRENGDLHHEQKQNLVNNHFGRSAAEEELFSSKKEISRLKTECTNLGRSVQEQSEKCDMLSKSTKSVLVRIFPPLKEKEWLDHDQFLSETEAVAKTTLKKEPANPIPKTEVKIVEKEVEKIVERVVQDPSLVKQVKELKEENANLENEMDVLRSQLSSSQSDELKMYQDVLQKTETLLRNLQKSVEEEEKQFLKKLQARDEQICQLERENQKLSLQQDLKTYCDSSEFRENERDLATLRRALEGERVQTVALKQRCALLEKELSELKVKSNGMLNGPSENEVKTLPIAE